MELNNSTVLVTGGTNGIGLEFAKQLLQLGANVIVTGRDILKLEQTKLEYPQINIIRSDVSNPDEVRVLHKQVLEQFPDLNIIINNAGVMAKEDSRAEELNMDDITREIDINFSGTARMVTQFLPFFKTKESAAIVNISSGLAFIPFANTPIYCGTKAAIHMYSLGLRLQLKESNIKVFEIAPPKTDKPMHVGASAAKSNVKMMKVEEMVNISLKGIVADIYEIRPGLSNVMKWMSRIAPTFFAKLVNKNAEKAIKK